MQNKNRIREHNKNTRKANIICILRMSMNTSSFSATSCEFANCNAVCCAVNELPCDCNVVM